jgi:hypothetical protein
MPALGFAGLPSYFTYGLYINEIEIYAFAALLLNDVLDFVALG